MEISDLETGVWAIVTVAGGKKIFGKLADEVEGRTKIQNAFSVLEADMPVGGPGGQLMGFNHIFQYRGLDNCHSPATVYVKPEAIHYLKDMEEDERRGHKELVKEALKSMMEWRAKSAGIELVGAHGPRRS